MLEMFMDGEMQEAMAALQEKRDATGRAARLKELKAGKLPIGLKDALAKHLAAPVAAKVAEQRKKSQARFDAICREITRIAVEAWRPYYGPETKEKGKSYLPLNATRGLFDLQVTKADGSSPTSLKQIAEAADYNGSVDFGTFQDANTKGQEDIWFQARDGYALKKITEGLPPLPIAELVTEAVAIKSALRNNPLADAERDIRKALAGCSTLAHVIEFFPWAEPYVASFVEEEGRPLPMPETVEKANLINSLMGVTDTSK